MEEMTNTDVQEETPLVVSPTSVSELEPKMKLKGTVQRLELYGAFIDIGVGTNALIHISKLGNDHVNRVSDVLSVGDEIDVWVEKVNPETNQIMVTMLEPLGVEWRDLDKGQTYTGVVTRLEAYGAFINIGAEREGLVHISEISHDYVKQPSEVLSVGDEVQVEVLGFSKRKRRIDLSIKNLLEKPEAQATSSSSQQNYAVPAIADTYEEEEEGIDDMQTAMEFALRQAMGDDSIDAISTTRYKKGRGNKKKKNRRNRRYDQDDLLERTLGYHK